MLNPAASASRFAMSGGAGKETGPCPTVIG